MEDENTLWDIRCPTLEESQNAIPGRSEVVGFGCSGGFKDESEVELISKIANAMSEART